MDGEAPSNTTLRDEVAIKRAQRVISVAKILRPDGKYTQGLLELAHNIVINSEGVIQQKSTEQMIDAIRESTSIALAALRPE